MNFPASNYLHKSNFYFFLALIVFAGAVMYGALHYRILSDERVAIISNEESRTALSDELAAGQTSFQSFAEQRAKKQEEFSKKIAAILPVDDNYTDLTRQIDNYFVEHDRPGNALFLSSLRFGKGAPVESTAALSVLPVSTNIEGTRDNFFKFLDFVKTSGSLESGTRLLEIKSIQLNFPEGGEVVKDLKQKLNFTVELNAYYQTPRVGRVH